MKNDIIVFMRYKKMTQENPSDIPKKEKTATVRQMLKHSALKLKFLATGVRFQKFILSLTLLCFFLAIPSVTYEISKKISVFGPFPILPKEPGFNPFVAPKELKPQIEFWKKIFSEYTADQMVIHDNWYVSVIYEVIDTSSPTFANKTEAYEAVKAEKEKYESILANLPWERSRTMNKEERRICSLFKNLPETPHVKKKDAKDRVRIQPGTADSFQNSIIRSGAYLESMKKIFVKQNVPEQLVYLPAIESSFDPFAVSNAGAAGLWQFMKRTGKHYKLTVNNLLDERRDPILSTKAAARFLTDNYNSLGSWPLAVAAYNYGVQGILNAVKSLESKEIEDIVLNYNGPKFEFASRNFYAQFLAAVEIGADYQSYFRDIEVQKPLEVTQLKLPDFISCETFEQYFPFKVEEIRLLNPSIDESVFKEGNFIPKNYNLNVPLKYKDILAQSYKAIPDSLKYQHIYYTKGYRVRRGQTLSEIASAHKVPIKTFMKLNGIKNPKMIRVGQLLKIPGEYMSLEERKTPYEPTSEKESNNRTGKNRYVRHGQPLENISAVMSVAESDSVKNRQKISPDQVMIIPEG